MSEMSAQKADRIYRQLRPLVRKTPTLSWDGCLKEQWLGDRESHLKLEFMQHSGSFKIRGALAVMLGNLKWVQERGVVAVSRGNHACAVSYAARELKTSAKVVVPRQSSSRRISKCKGFGADVILVEGVKEAFAMAEKIEREEGRFPVHPYEGKLTALGTAGVAKEFFEQAPSLEEIYVACGGGGLLAGIAAYTKQVFPRCRVIGVEPERSAVMTRSLEAGRPLSVEVQETIADSLSPVSALPYSFGLCQKYVDEMVLVSEEEMLETIRGTYQDLSLVFEPSGVAALTGAVKKKSQASNIGVVLCGANIALSEFQSYL